MFQVTSKPFRESESPTPKRYFDKEWPKEEHITAISMKQSIANKEERNGVKTRREKTLSEVLMEGFKEEQEQRRLEEEADNDREENTIYNTNNVKGNR